MKDCVQLPDTEHCFHVQDFPDPRSFWPAESSTPSITDGSDRKMDGWGFFSKHILDRRTTFFFFFFDKHNIWRIPPWAQTPAVSLAPVGEYLLLDCGNIQIVGLLVWAPENTDTETQLLKQCLVLYVFY